MSLFLTTDEVAELTGIRRGRDGKTREQLQADELLRMHIPFRVNAANRPIVTVAAIEGNKQAESKQPASAWQSNVLKLEKRA